MNDMSYNNWKAMSDKMIMQAIGKFIQAERLKQNISQSKVASSAGISRSTLSLLERGETVRMDSFIQVLRVLDLLHVLEVFAIKDEISPIAYAKLKKKQRKKASPGSDFNLAAEPKDLEW